jgi:acetyl esterase/lipase
MIAEDLNEEEAMFQGTTIFRPVGVMLSGLLLIVLVGCTNPNASAPTTPPPTIPPTVEAQATATATVSASPPYQVNTLFNLSYGPLGTTGEALDLCTPVGAAGLRPGVLLIHGGFWSSGDKRTYSSQCTQLAEQGFVAAALNYRLAPDSYWPAQVVDVQLALRWLRAHASDYHLDSSRVCALGDSAGGHLAVFLGVLGKIHAGDQAGLLADQPVRVSCVVDLFGPVDLTTIGTPNQRQALASGLLGETALQQHPELLRDASPVFAVSAQSVPTLIVQGTQDGLVPPSQSQELQRALQRAGVAVQYLSYVGGHEFSGLSQAQQDALTLQILQFLMTQEHP